MRVSVCVCGASGVCVCVRQCVFRVPSVYIRIHSCTHIHTCTHIRTRTHMHARTHMHIRTIIHTRTHIHTVLYRETHTHIYTHIHTHKHIRTGVPFLATVLTAPPAVTADLLEVLQPLFHKRTSAMGLPVSVLLCGKPGAGMYV